MAASPKMSMRKRSLMRALTPAGDADAVAQWQPHRVHPLVCRDEIVRAAENPGNPGIRREGTLLGALFESLVTQSVRVYAQVAEARVSHLRTHRGTTRST